jgi:prepilin-type N-terminal cleavage/methylation domain-containing protein
VGNRRGFTLMELVFGVLILSLIAGAVAGLTRAVAMDWEQSEQTQTVDLRASLIAARLESMLRQAKYIGLVRPGSLDGSASKPAAVMLWLNDSDGSGTMTFPELGLLQHDTSSNTLYLYTVKFPSGWSATQIASWNTAVSYATLCGSTAPEDFKGNTSVVSAQALAHNVTGFKVAAHWLPSWPQKPTLDFELKIYQAGAKDANGVQRTPDRVQYQYGSAVLRAPSQPS